MVKATWQNFNYKLWTIWSNWSMTLQSWQDLICKDWVLTLYREWIQCSVHYLYCVYRSDLYKGRSAEICNQSNHLVFDSWITIQIITGYICFLWRQNTYIVLLRILLSYLKVIMSVGTQNLNMCCSGKRNKHIKLTLDPDHQNELATKDDTEGGGSQNPNILPRHVLGAALKAAYGKTWQASWTLWS